MIFCLCESMMILSLPATVHAVLIVLPARRLRRGARKAASEAALQRCTSAPPTEAPGRCVPC